MSQVTKIEKQKNKNRVNIFIDGDFFCGLLTETAVMFGLKVGTEISEQALLKIVRESEVKSAFAKASDIISRRMHSAYELSKKLTNKGFEEQVVKEAIEKLKNYGYVDDLVFANEFVRQNKKYPSKMLEKKLFERGIDKAIVHEVLNDIDESAEMELCKKCAEKYLKTHDISKPGFKQKLYSSLIGKGFSFEMAKMIIEKMDIPAKFD